MELMRCMNTLGANKMSADSVLRSGVVTHCYKMLHLHLHQEQLKHLEQQKLLLQ